jgi:hypothetical protein
MHTCDGACDNTPKQHGSTELENGGNLQHKENHKLSYVCCLW